MNRTNLFIVIFKYVPFITGIILCSVSIINLFSLLLLFVGGYIAIKNTFDYRKVRKNMNMVYSQSEVVREKNYKEVVNGYNFHKVKGMVKVKKRTK